MDATHCVVYRFPIANDPLYNSELFGPTKGKGGQLNKTHEQLIRDLIANHTVENWIQSEEFKTSRLGNSLILKRTVACDGFWLNQTYLVSRIESN